VGESSPDCGDHSSVTSRNLLICSCSPSVLLTSFTSRLNRSITSGISISSLLSLNWTFWDEHQSCRYEKFGDISALANFSFSPITITCSIKNDSFSRFSITWGAIYLPAESLNISFFLSVILRNFPSVITPISPVWNHPSLSIASAVSSGSL